MRREKRTFEIVSDKPDEMKRQLNMQFPSFLATCMADKATHHIKYSMLGNARFEKEIGMDILQWMESAFYNKSKEKHTKRTLNISKDSDI